MQNVKSLFLILLGTVVTIYTTRFNIEFRPHVADEVYSVIAKSDYWLHHVCLPVRLSALKSSAPTGWIFMKFGIDMFFGNLSRKFKFR
jgi:hypothetical protein